MSIVIQHEFTTQQLADALTPEALTEALLIKIKTTTPTSPAHTPKIGEHWTEQGGIYAGVMRGENGADYYLIIAPTNTEKTLVWGPRDKSIEGAKSFLDGAANTRAILREEATYPAATESAALTANGFQDWYLPARHELRLAYLNAPEAFDTSTWYWSSTQYAGGDAYAWLQYFDDGNQGYLVKDYEGRVRAVRRFLIP